MLEFNGFFVNIYFLFRNILKIKIMKINSTKSNLLYTDIIMIFLLLLIGIGITVYFLMEGEIREYFLIRHDYTIYKRPNLSVCWIDDAQNGYITSLGIYAEDISDSVISDINRLKQLEELRVITKKGFTGHENVSNLSLIKKLCNINKIYIQVGDIPPIQFLELPPTIKTIGLQGGTGLNNKELMKLKDFTHIKNIIISTQTISDKDIDEFRKIRPDVDIEHYLTYGIK
jgi:hypothetical protein